MHVLMMVLYAAVAATVLSTIDPRASNNSQRVRHGLKMFGAFLGIGLLLAWVLLPIPW